jgi:L-lactate dehydrogenase complex protein LldE
MIFLHQSLRGERTMPVDADRKIRVALFVTCLVDLMRPSVGFAAVKLLEDAGCTVEVPLQTCCGQPAYNSGDRGTTRDLAERMIETFQPYDYVVAPSGSCVGMVRAHYPELFEDDPNLRPKADALAAKTYELTSFLVDVLGVTRVDAAYEGVSPTTTPARACANSASRRSRGGFWAA